jgi:hypothetical protein
MIALDSTTEGFRKAGYKIENRKSEDNTDSFRTGWMVEGIAAMAFLGHGHMLTIGKHSIGNGYYPVRSEVNSSKYQRASQVRPAYGLQLVMALTCGSDDAGWDTHAARNGVFVGLIGRVNTFKLLTPWAFVSRAGTH